MLKLNATCIAGELRCNPVPCYEYIESLSTRLTPFNLFTGTIHSNLPYSLLTLPIACARREAAISFSPTIDFPIN